MDERLHREEGQKICDKRERPMDTHENANTDDGIQIRKVACDRILRRIEQGNGKRANQDRHIEIRDPGWKFFESVSVWIASKEAASESPSPNTEKKQ